MLQVEPVFASKALTDSVTHTTRQEVRLPAMPRPEDCRNGTPANDVPVYTTQFTTLRLFAKEAGPPAAGNPRVLVVGNSCNFPHLKHRVTGFLVHAVAHAKLSLKVVVALVKRRRLGRRGATGKLTGRRRRRTACRSSSAGRCRAHHRVAVAYVVLSTQLNNVMVAVTPNGTPVAARASDTTPRCARRRRRRYAAARETRNSTFVPTAEADVHARCLEAR